MKKKSALKFLPFYPLIIFIFQVRRNGGIKVKKSRFVFIFFVKCLFLEPFRLLELIFFERKIRNYEMELEPVFILGHWRSGTTYLQHLLSVNKNHTTISVYQFVFADVFITTQKWLKPPLNLFCRWLKIPYSFQRVPMDLDLPGELEPAMWAMGSSTSYTWGHFFPTKFSYWRDRFISIKNSVDAKNWLDDYEYLIKKFSYASGGKRMIVKSPGDTARIRDLLNRFPNAKFVYIERDKNEVLRSTRYLWDVIRKEFSLQIISDDKVEKIIHDSYKLMFSAYKEQKNLIKDQLVEISCEELIQEPIKVMKRIYSVFGFGEVPVKKIMKVVEHLKAKRSIQ